MRQYSARVYRLGHGTHNLVDAEDVVQDVFLTICRKGESFEGRSALGRLDQSYNGEHGAEQAPGEAPGGRDLPRGGSSRDTWRTVTAPACARTSGRIGRRIPRPTCCRATRAILDRAIDSLPERYRAVLILRDVDELSNEEVAPR
jgi:RNA polymerase sigma-70 factor (ECF subfamily)